MEEIKLNIDNQTNKTKTKNILVGIIIFALCLSVILPIVLVLVGDSNEEIPSTLYYIGETATTPSNICVTINEVENTQILGSPSLGDTTNNNFIVLSCRIINKSKKTIRVYSDTFALFNEENIRYEYKTSLFVDSIIGYEDFSPGVSKTYEFVFETPTTTEQETYTAIFGQNASNKNKLKFVLKNKI